MALTHFMALAVFAAQSESVTVLTITGNVKMYEKDYFVYIDGESKKKKLKILYPSTGDLQMIATGRVYIETTPPGSSWIVQAEEGVVVYATGVDSTLTVFAGGDVEVQTTGKGSTVTGTYGKSISVQKDNVGENGAVDLKPLGDNQSSSSTIIIQMVICLFPLLLLV